MQKIKQNVVEVVETGQKSSFQTASIFQGGHFSKDIFQMTFFRGHFSKDIFQMTFFKGSPLLLLVNLKGLFCLHSSFPVFKTQAFSPIFFAFFNGIFLRIKLHFFPLLYATFIHLKLHLDKCLLDKCPTTYCSRPDIERKLPPQLQFNVSGPKRLREDVKN